MEKDYVDYNTLAAIMAPQTQALQQIATRPQKTSSITNTTFTSTPYALEDLIAARDSLGTATRNLDEALKAREGLGYTLASALSSIPEQQGYGSWLSALGRSFGAGLGARTNAEIDRAQKVYDAQMKDLANRLAFDKAMGETTTQRQAQEIGYTPMEYPTSTGGKGAGAQGTQQQVPVLNPEYWEQMISNFDEKRPTEASYRNMSQVRRNIRNSLMIAGTPDENYARDQFAVAKGREFLPMARNALKGAGQITDFEDKKYSEWINKVQDPVQLKDTAVRIVDDVAIKNGWSKEQKAQGLEMLGLTSEARNLLPQQIEAEPERIKGGLSIEDILKKHNAKRVD